LPKAIKVFQLLTKYLVSKKKVVIPSIGSFAVVTEPARYDVADKVILPPVVNMVYKDDQLMGDEQVEFLSSELKQDKTNTLKQLTDFGENVRKALKYQAFHWNGVGELELVDNNISFVPVSINLLEPVPAARVIHRDAEHTIRRGETEVSKSFSKEEKTITIIQKKIKRDIAAWIVLLLGIIFIGFLLYQAGGNIHVTGMGKRLW
jgi:hypothetical protein